MLVFSLRCLLSKYNLPHGKNCMVLGTVFGFFQLNMTVGSFALTSSVLMRANNVMDLFMNFLAISFLSEIPTTLVEMNILKPLMDRVEFSFVVNLRDGDADLLSLLPYNAPVAPVPP